MTRKEKTLILSMIGGLLPFSSYAGQTFPPTPDQVIKQSYLGGEPVKVGDLPGEYNQSANYYPVNSHDLYVTGNFIFWSVQQDLMRVGNLLDPSSSGALGLLQGTDKIVIDDGRFSYGFQVGMGFKMKGMDNWNLYSEYTWYQNVHTDTVDAGEGETLFSSARDKPVGITNYMIVADSISKKSSYYYNNLNLSLQRPFYFGRKLVANVGAGLRGLWLSQTLLSTLEGTTAITSGALGAGYPLADLYTNFHQKFWALGPRVEVESSWIFGNGFRFVANIAESILYTRYTSLRGSIKQSSNIDFKSNVSIYNTLRTVTETSLGMEWGTYCGDHNDYHGSLSVNYEFNVYWNQNMFGMVISEMGGPSNTYIQGVNASARLDF